MRHTTRNAAPLTPSFSITLAGSYANVGRASMASRTLTSCPLCHVTLSARTLAALAAACAQRCSRNRRGRRRQCKAVGAASTRSGAIPSAPCRGRQSQCPRQRLLLGLLLSPCLRLG
ncbi:Os07g0181400 [Oryza sativa Japonica Group]|uniref:Os07g0181400 protein n=2 Tax=Oryza TaxID=4527 RepID=A0A0P0X358_ORYSJ|nr:Os07g0181400 [Oryza sativa Japonica Group]